MVQKCKYLGAVTDEKSNITHTIQGRIQYANLQLLKSKDINRDMKM
jgi:hypothetical protein